MIQIENFDVFSDEGKTRGVGDWEQKFVERGGPVNPKRMYFARLNGPR